MPRRQRGVALAGIRRVDGGKLLGVHGGLGGAHPAVAFEARHRAHEVGVDQPVPGRHRGAVVEQRCVADHRRPTGGCAHHDLELRLVLRLLADLGYLDRETELLRCALQARVIDESSRQESLARQREEGLERVRDCEERVENEIIGPMRDEKFSSWQLLFCPPSWAARYKAYMSRHNVPFEEQWVDDGPCFLIPKQYRPHTWRLGPASIPRRIKSA